MEEKVRWTIQASENLEEIFDFLERTNSSDYASKVIENIYYYHPTKTLRVFKTLEKIQ